MSLQLTILFGSIVAALIYLWHQWKFSYWQRHNVKFLKPFPFLGNFKEMFQLKNSFFLQINQLYRSTKEPVVGIYLLSRPALLVRDLDLIKRILVTDFNQFSNRALEADPIHDRLGSQNLFMIRNPLWKEIRAMISPVYSSSKLKQMYPLMVEVGWHSFYFYMDYLLGIFFADFARARVGSGKTAKRHRVGCQVALHTLHHRHDRLHRLWSTRQ